jgi:hypothetical protein
MTVAIGLWSRSSVRRRARRVSLLLLVVDSGQYSIPKFLKAEEDVAQRAVMCEELDLSRAIKENVVICHAINIISFSFSMLLRTSELFQAFLEPVKVLL